MYLNGTITRRAKKVRKGDRINLAGTFYEVRKTRTNGFGEIVFVARRGRGKFAIETTFIVPAEHELKIHRYPKK